VAKKTSDNRCVVHDGEKEKISLQVQERSESYKEKEIQTKATTCMCFFEAMDTTNPLVFPLLRNQRRKECLHRSHPPMHF
jgi:hypothetical protein